MKVLLRALKRMGRVAPGETFYKGRMDANLLIALKVAELAPDVSETNEQDDAPRRRRSYRRRDMTAEGSEE